MKGIDITCSDIRLLRPASLPLWRQLCAAIARVRRMIDEWRAASRTARELAVMSDRDLRDIGLIRTDIAYVFRRPSIGRPASI